MSVEFLSIDNSEAVNASDKVFDLDFNEGLVHQSVVCHLANARIWSAKKKNRSERKGGGAKPWRQKGTGRARAGSIRSPIWRGGGKTFAPKVINYSQKMNKKMQKASLRSLLSELYRNGRIKVFSDFNLDDCRTKTFLKKIADWDIKEKNLMIFNDIDENTYLSSRNLENIDIADCEMINTYLLLSYDLILIESSVISKLEERLK